MEGALVADCVLERNSVNAAIAVMAQLSRKLFLVISGPFQSVGFYLLIANGFEHSTVGLNPNSRRILHISYALYYALLMYVNVFLKVPFGPTPKADQKRIPYAD
ncbi:MAG: hypothetical protein COA84_00935 [Robiginitomaculum sp.]|nr:MAG: hypothetical protein COA84_00935 [Robiginitomaculum sp.]